MAGGNLNNHSWKITQWLIQYYSWLFNKYITFRHWLIGVSYLRLPWLITLKLGNKNQKSAENAKFIPILSKEKIHPKGYGFRWKTSHLFIKLKWNFNKQFKLCIKNDWISYTKTAKFFSFSCPLVFLQKARQIRL